MSENKVDFECECGVPTYIWNESVWACPMCKREITQQICRTGCDTQDHKSYWECLQAANVSIDKTSLRP